MQTMNKTRNNYERFIILIAGLLLLNIQLINASDSLITVGIYQNPPKLYWDENRKPAGIFVELLEEIARLENWKLEYIFCTWNECMEALESGEIDLMPDVAFTFERTQRLRFNAIPVAESWSQVYTNPKTTVTELSDLQDKAVALMDASVQQAYFRQIMNGFGYPYREVHAASFPDAFSEVKIGVADAAVVNHFFGETQYKKYDLVKTPVIFNIAVLHFAVKKGNKEWLIAVLDEYLANWKQTPQSFYYKTLSKHVQSVAFSPETHSHTSFYFLIAAILLAGVLLYLILIKLYKKQNRVLVKTNKKLRYEEQKFRGYIEHAPYGIFVVNEKGKYVEANQTGCKLTGYSKQEIIGKAIPDFVPEEGKELAKNHFYRVTTEGKASGIIPFITKNGEKRLMKIIAVKISPKRFIGFVEDVSEEQRTRNRLHIMSKVVDQSVNEIYLIDISNFKFRQVNEAAAKNTGYAPWELAKMTPRDLNPNVSANEFEAIIQPVLKKEKKMIIFETKHFRKDGTYYEAEIYLQLLENENEKLLSAVVQDITERKKHEKELQQIRNRLEREVEEKTRELNARINELESFREATIERELRMEELRQEIARLKNERK